MGWNKITIDTLTSAEDMISYELTELGATGVEVEDHVSLTEEEMKVMYVDLLPDDIAPDDGKAKISCYFDENENLEHITMQIQAMLERLRGIPAFLLFYLLLSFQLSSSCLLLPLLCHTQLPHALRN